jgi:hypothetical protein
VVANSPYTYSSQPGYNTNIQAQSGFVTGGLVYDFLFWTLPSGGTTTNPNLVIQTKFIPLLYTATYTTFPYVCTTAAVTSFKVGLPPDYAPALVAENPCPQGLNVQKTTSAVIDPAVVPIILFGILFVILIAAVVAKGSTRKSKQ